MSVLFEALHRASAEEAQVLPVESEADIVRFFTPAPPPRFRGALGFALCALCVFGTAAVLGFSPAGATLHPVEVVAPKKQEAALPAEPPLVLPKHTSKTPSGRSVHAKTIQADPDGIALPVEALKEVRSTDHALGSSARPAKEKKLTKAEKAQLKKREKLAEKHVVVTENNETTPDVALSSAHDLLEDGKYRPAMQRYDEILSKDPSNKTALEGKVYALQQLPPAEAVPALEKITRANASFAPAFAGLARAEARRGDTKSALTSWRKAVALDADNNLYRLSLAILYDRVGQGEAALTTYRSLAQPWPQQVQDRVAYLSGDSDDKAPKAEPTSDQP